MNPTRLLAPFLVLLTLTLLAGCGGGGGGGESSGPATPVDAQDRTPDRATEWVVLTSVGSVTVRHRTVKDGTRSFTAELRLENAGTADATNWALEVAWDRTISLLSTGVTLSGGPGLSRFQGLAIPAGTALTVQVKGTPGRAVAPTSPVLTFQTASPSPSPFPSPTASPSPSPSPSSTGGFLHTEGSRILDGSGNVVRLTGISWFGFETTNFAPHGLWTRSMDSMLDQVTSLGYNCLRVPYTNEMLLSGSKVSGVDFGLNPDLTGLTPLQVLDVLIQKAGARGLKVVLDRHRPTAAAQSDLWYTDQVSQEKWIVDWVMLAHRYRTNPTVVGFDLHNEPHGRATWGDGNAATDWRLAAEAAGNRILAVHPDLLILVEGVEAVDGNYYWWGGNLRAAGRSPVRLNVAGRLVYSTHDYPASVYPQSWFSSGEYPANLPGVWDANWGYLVRLGTAPVLVGEFGTHLGTDSDRQWLKALTDYMAAGGHSFTYWSLNPNSGDTGGILADDWITVQQAKQDYLTPLLASLWPLLARTQ